MGEQHVKFVQYDIQVDDMNMHLASHPSILNLIMESMQEDPEDILTLIDVLVESDKLFIVDKWKDNTKSNENLEN